MSIPRLRNFNFSKYFDRKHVILYFFGIVYLTFFLNLLFWNSWNYLLLWFVFFFIMLVWGLEFDPSDFDKSLLTKLILIILIWSGGIALVTNIYIWLWYLLLNIGIFYALYSCFWYKNLYKNFSIRSYAMHGLFYMAYIMWFGVWIFVIWNYNIVDFNCDKIYWYFNQITTVFDTEQYYTPTTNASIVTDLEYWSGHISTVDTKAYFAQKWDDISSTFTQYKNEFLNDVVEQRKIINQEFCDISVKQINRLYQSDGIKLWVIAFMWLFLYPFFVILFYLYWFISWLLLKVLLLLWVRQYKKKTDEITYIE